MAALLYKAETSGFGVAQAEFMPRVISFQTHSLPCTATVYCLTAESNSCSGKNTN